MLCLFILAAVSSALCAEPDGGKAFRIPLNDGNAIPAMGLGTYYGTFSGIETNTTLDRHEIETAVTYALEAGYRMIDTAASYQNEEQIANGVRASSVPRSDVFIVTKLPTNGQRDVLKSLRRSLEELDMSYVDLYLIHFPVAEKPDFSGYDVVDYLDTWKGMEEAKKLGLAKSIGISNFNISQIERLLANCEIKPAALEVEVNLDFAQDKLLKFCKSQDIVVIAYTPFGSMFNIEFKPIVTRPNNPTLVALVNKYHKTPAQIALRYSIQRGVVPIPKTSGKSRIEENIDVFDLELSAEDMKALSKLNKDFRSVHFSFWQDHPYYPYEHVDEPHTKNFIT